MVKHYAPNNRPTDPVKNKIYFAAGHRAPARLAGIASAAAGEQVLVYGKKRYMSLIEVFPGQSSPRTRNI